jgi:DNA-binding NarL/FixJ family response regulator
MGDELLRHGLVHLLSRIDQFDFIGDVRRDGSLVDRLRALRPDLLLLCVDDAPPLADLLDQLELRPKVVVVTHGAGNGAKALELIRAGADALIDRRSSSSELLNTVQRVAAGQTALDPHSVTTLITELRLQRRGHESDAVTNLTRREREVLALITDGLDNRTIARDLFISEATVKFHLHNIMNKFGVRKRSALVSAVLRGHVRQER